ncbi:FliH/SctL family protein [Aurantiacibacter odishensis]|uniref:FliH/SctL family protein n=1 Tax=Aurantiacibacter odishensis TaxID=1155476 RepID=UPI000E7736EC|nr:FliH/SctL family protein [Aurantiacibacter odishensis]
MANSFEPLTGFAGTAEAEPPTPWFAALSQGSGFQPDARFGAAPAPIKEPEPERPDAVLADMLADAEARGREAALAEMASEGAARAALKLSFQKLDAQLNEQLAQRLAETVAALCESALAPMVLDSEALQRRCKNAADLLTDATDARLRLHPDDTALLDPQFAQCWTIVSAPEQARGTVVFETADGTVRDGPDEWRSALRETLGLC